MECSTPKVPSRKRGGNLEEASAQDPKDKGNSTRLSTVARSGDAIRVSAKDGELR